jgi:endoglucanase
MLSVRLNTLSKVALIALSLATPVACSSVEDGYEPATERAPTSPLPPGKAPSAPADPGAPPSNPEAPATPPSGEPPPAPGEDPADAGSSPTDDASTPSDPPTPTPPTPTPTPPTPTPPTPSLTRLRGTNLVGMEGNYTFKQSSGPAPDSEYAVHSNQIIDYLVAKKVDHIRFLFSWERMQSTLGGPIPAASSGNYKAYYDDYKRIVDYATSKGMTVVIEPWQPNSSGGAGGARWRGDLVGGGTVTSAHFADFWSKMAAIYATNPRVAIGLVNEPNNMSTMSWFSIAQDAVTAIRKTGFAGEIFVPGNGWTGAASWNDSWYDTASTKRSNAYGWLNARGPGQPLSDPLGKLTVEIHSYADSDASGGSTEVVSTTASRDRMKGVVDWARANKLKVWVGEIGMYAGATNASANWSNFVSYLDSSADTLTGFAWWACGKPGWWNDVAANGGGHFSITPTNNYTTDTVNMKMIAGSFGK